MNEAMITGDSQAVAKAVADEPEIDTYFAEVLPEDKDKKVAELQGQNSSDGQSFRLDSIAVFIFCGSDALLGVVKGDNETRCMMHKLPQ